MAIRKIVARSIGVDVITAEDLADNSITAAEITNGAVTADKLASNSVTTAKITDANVTTGKLATDLVVTHALGSASTPSLTFTGDTNTGIFSPAADTIAFAEGGAEVARFDSSGNLGVATTTPLEKLDVRAANATFSSNGENTNVFITSGYDSGIRYVSRLRTDFNGVFSIATGSGSNTVAPSSNSQTVRLNITDAGLLQFNSGYGSVATAYGCRAWVNFNGTGTVSIRASGNVSSITDNGTGSYRVNFTTAMTDVNYSVCATANNGANYVALIAAPEISASTASYAQINTARSVDFVFDARDVDVAIFR
jgi:hypothetical protein